MEKISYDEARQWFWIRTWLWFAVLAVLMVMGTFAYSADLIKEFSARFLASLIVGIVAPLLGLAAAAISLQFTWMRMGWRLAFALNGPVCAGMAGLIAAFVCVFALSYMRGEAVHPPSEATIQTAYSLMEFGIGASALLGFIFGSWFAMRRDKYFVELI